MADRHWQWEYKIVFYISRSSLSPTADAAELQTWLNSLGDAGWELVSWKDNMYVFKRAKMQ